LQRKVRIRIVRVDDINDPATDIEAERLDVSNIAASIKTVGEPYYLPYVRPLADGRYQLIRYSTLLKGARAAGLKKVSVIVKDVSDQETLLMILSAAPGVKPLSEAEAINMLRTRYRTPVRDIVIKTGKSRKWISDRIKIWESSSFIKNALGRGTISLPVALEICNAPIEHHKKILEEIRKYRLGSNVRAVATLSKIYSVAEEVEKEAALWSLHAILKSLTPFGHGLRGAQWYRTQEVELEADCFQDRKVCYVLYSEKRKRVLACVDENCDVIVSGLTLRDAIDRLVHEHAHYNIAVSFNAGMEAYDNLAKDYGSLVNEWTPLYVKDRYRGHSEEDIAGIVKEQIREKHQTIKKRRELAERWLYQHTEQLAKWLAGMIYSSALFG